MPFKQNPLDLTTNSSEVVVNRIVQEVTEDGLVLTRLEKVNKLSPVVINSCDFREYSLEAQIKAGDTIKKVNTVVLNDDFDSITSEMVQPLIDNSNEFRKC